MAQYTYQGPEESPVASINQSPMAQSLAAELQSPASAGERHNQIKRTILPLLELGLCDTAIFTQYRGMYDADVSDAEILEFIKWGRAKLLLSASSTKAPAKKRKLTDEERMQNAIGWLKGDRVTEGDLWEESQLHSDGESDAVLYLSLFQSDDFVNVNTRYIIRKLKDGSEKAELCGPGLTMLTTEWIDSIHQSGIPEGRAGTWVRVNPLRAKQGHSQSGAHTDADVLRYSKFLLESDILPYDIALSLLAKVPLPICAIVDTAGRGPHGIVSVNAADAIEYARKVGDIIDLMEPLGIDSGNKNPSRYSRLPGAKRVIGTRTDTSIQKLLYITNNPKTGGIFSP